MSKLRPTRINLAEDRRQGLARLLNSLVTSLIDLRIQVKLAHWNVRGPHFIAYHELFDEVASHLEDATDLAAERAATLGAPAGAPLQTVARDTPLEPWPLDERQDQAVMRIVADRVGQVAAQARAGIDAAAELGDQDTADLFTEVSRQLDKDLWFLEAHLGDEGWS